jgi:hypothetical protein
MIVQSPREFNAIHRALGILRQDLHHDLAVSLVVSVVQGMQAVPAQVTP